MIEHKVTAWYPPFVDESELFQAMLSLAVERLTHIVDNENWRDFPQAYQALVNACNACHSATNHAYIRIKVPGEPTYHNQEYQGSTK